MANSRLNIFCLLIVLATGVLGNVPVLAATDSSASAEELRIRDEIQKLSSFDSNVRKQALQTISDIATKSRVLDPGDLLAIAYDNQYEEVRYGVIELMSKLNFQFFRNQPNAYLKTFIKAANDSNAKTRFLAVDVLANYSSRRSPEVKKILTEKFRDSDKKVRAAAIIAWFTAVNEKFPSSANPVDMLNYPDENIVGRYIVELRNLNFTNVQKRKLVQAAFKHPSPLIKAEAIYQLIGMINLNDRKLWDKMLVVINAYDTPDQVKTSAISALVKFSKPDNPYVQDVMTKLAKSRNPATSKAALSTFEHFSLDRKKLSSEIRQLITSNDVRSQNIAVELIARTGVSDTKSAKKTVSFLANEKYDQLQVVLAVKSLSENNNLENAVPGLVKVLQNIRNTNSNLPHNVGSALHIILDNAKNQQQLAFNITQDILRQWRQASSPVPSKQIVQAIKQMMIRKKYDLKKSPQVLEKLCSYYVFEKQHGGSPYSYMITIFRGNIGDSAIDPLIKMLSDSSPEQRACAADALRNYRYWARSAIPALKKLTNDQDPMVSSMARRSLETISKSPREVKPNLQVQTIQIK